MLRGRSFPWLLCALVTGCGGTEDNDQPEDCAGVAGGDAVVDECGTCDDDPSNDCLQDCTGTWGGEAVLDECNTCDDDPSNDCAEDCAGAWGGEAVADECGTCDDDPSNDCVQDCAGTWGGAALEDDCGTCDDDPGNDCVDDCRGVLGGPAYMDRCGTCIDRDGAEPAPLWVDETERPMGADCTDLPLPAAFLAEAVEIDVRSEAAGVSNASVVLRNIAGEEVGSIPLEPANHETMGTTEVLERPVVIATLTLCSPGNPSTLLGVTILGSPLACVGDCADHWPAERSYRDTCAACIDRDALPPEVLWSDQTVRLMDDECSEHDIPGSFLVEELFATTRNRPGAISDAFVYLLDPAGATVGNINLFPEDQGTVSGTAVFDPPIAVSSMQICSWWNDADLLEVRLLGDPAACAP